LNNFPNALKQAKLAYALFDNNERLEVLLVHLYFINKNIAKSKEMLEIVQNKNLTHHLIDNVTGRLALMEKNYQKAIESFTHLYEQKPTGYNAIKLARALKFNHQQKEAETTLEKYLEKNKLAGEVRLLLASLYTNNDRQKKVKQYQELLSVNPKNIKVLNNLAWNQFKLNDFEQALIHSEASYKIDQKNLAIQETYGVVLLANNKRELGMIILEQAVANGSNDIEVRISLAESYMAQGNKSKATSLIKNIQTTNRELQRRIERIAK